MPSLLNWYPVEVAILPIHIGRVACQRSNCWWDSKQRRRYAASIVGSVVVVFVAVLWFALGSGFTVEDFMLRVAAPLAPALVLGVRQFTEHMEAAARLDRLKEHAERLWSEVLSGKSAGYMTTAARALQDEILDGRKRNPLVFDAVFKRLRRDYEIQMNHGAAELVLEARRKLSLP